MRAAFDFDDSGKTYTCQIETRRGARPADGWWWFAVSGDGHRYAPFQASTDDTEDGVRTRIVAYYDALLARRAMPAAVRQHWARRTPAAAPGDVATGADLGAELDSAAPTA